MDNTTRQITDLIEVLNENEKTFVLDMINKLIAMRKEKPAR